MNCYPNCGCSEFISELNKYDVYSFKDGNFQIIRSESYDDDGKIFCRECSESVIVKNGKIVLENSV